MYLVSGLAAVPKKLLLPLSRGLAILTDTDIQGSQPFGIENPSKINVIVKECRFARPSRAMPPNTAGGLGTL